MNNNEPQQPPQVGQSELTDGLGDDINSLPRRKGKIIGIFQQPNFWASMEFIFWRTLCPTPDKSRLHAWWYGASAYLAGICYRKSGVRCKVC